MTGERFRYKWSFAIRKANSEDVADAGNDTLTSPEHASVFLEALSGDWSMHGAGQKY